MPWEIFYSKAVGMTSPYWIITKTGELPGYTGSMFMIPEMKLGFIVLMNGYTSLELAIPCFASLVPAFEETFSKYAVIPPSPSNITKFSGVYLATALLGAVGANVTVQAVETDWGYSYLNVSFLFRFVSSLFFSFLINSLFFYVFRRSGWRVERDTAADMVSMEEIAS